MSRFAFILTMAQASLDLEYLNLDSTDDWVDNVLDEVQALEENPTELEEVFEQVSLAGLIEVCTRLSDPKVTVHEELVVANKLLKSIEIDTVPNSLISALLDSIKSAFPSFNRVTIKNKQERLVRIERNFLNSKSKERAEIVQRWDEILRNCVISPDTNSLIVLQHILVHFWTVGKTHPTTAINPVINRARPDESELRGLSKEHEISSNLQIV